MDQNPNTEPTEREKYIANLEDKLRKAGRAQRFTKSEDGGVVTEYLEAQINAIVKNIGGTKYINDHSLYVYDTGQLAMAQKLYNMLLGEAATDTADLNAKLEAAKNDG